jgi:hypothetical protein
MAAEDCCPWRRSGEEMSPSSFRSGHTSWQPKPSDRSPQSILDKCHSLACKEGITMCQEGLRTFYMTWSYVKRLANGPLLASDRVWRFPYCPSVTQTFSVSEKTASKCCLVNPCHSNCQGSPDFHTWLTCKNNEKPRPANCTLHSSHVRLVITNFKSLIFLPSIGN